MSLLSCMNLGLVVYGVLCVSLNGDLFAYIICSNAKFVLTTPLEGKSPPSYVKNNQPAYQWNEISLFSGNLSPHGVQDITFSTIKTSLYRYYHKIRISEHRAVQQGGVAHVYYCNREGPTQSIIARRFFEMWVLITLGC